MATSAGLYGSRTDTGIARSAMAEAIGTFILVFGGTSVATAAVLERPTAGSPYDSLAVALAFGLALIAVVVCLGHVSGAHVNPAVTIALAAAGRFPWRYVPAYVVAQLVGAVLGAAGTWIAYGALGRDEARLAATYPALDVGAPAALAIEGLITFILVLVVIAAATDERVPPSAAGVAVGFALALGVFIGGPVTGGAVNPARALGPMLVAADLSDAWIYLLAPTLGGVCAALLYERFLRAASAPDEPSSPARAPEEAAT